MWSEVEEDMLARLLPFHRRIVEELIREDGLCVLSAGMGWQKVVAVLLRLQMERLRSPQEAGTLLVLGSTDWQRDMIQQELVRIDPSLAVDADAEEAGTAIVQAGALQLPEAVTNETPAQARVDLYRSKPCLFVTTRILVVDMLSKRIAGKEIAGIILMNAHRVTDSSQDGFAVRLFRETNRTGFVRAFSDQPNSFASGFAKVEKVMKALFLRKLHLWPRFESCAKESLDAVEKDIQVIELEVVMTPSMEEIYCAVAELMESCIKELRKSNKIDASELTIENGIFRSFDDMVRRQLDSVWHTVSPRTKQIVADLKTLRGLAERLLSYDAVTFLGHLDALRITEGVASIWLFHDAAHTIFDQAKKRMYQLQMGGIKRKASSAAGGKAKKSKPEGQAGSTEEDVEIGAPVVRPILEPLPKWDLVLEIMQEVQTERKRMSEEASTSGREAIEAPVLIVASEVRSCLQLRQVLQSGGSEAMMEGLYSDYLVRRYEGKSRNEAPRGRGGGRGRGRGGRGRGPTMRLEQMRAQRLQGDKAEQEALMVKARSLAEAAKRGRGGEGGRGAGSKKRASKKAKQAESPEKPNEPPEEPPPEPAEEQSPLLEGVHFLALEGRNMGMLWDVRPAFVIVYDPDIAFVRQLEVYKAESPGQSLRVYNMWYARSLEFDRYTAALQREQKIFEDLIQQKAYIVLPDIDQDLGALVSREPRERPSAMHPDVVLALQGQDGNRNALSRQGGNRGAPRVLPTRLVVDVREFMSSLPAVLYQQGLNLVPLTLEVGDYILSPEMCVERKSLSDLRGSFISGRLFHQAESMSRHYKTPILLIEFERDKAFVLHAPSDISADIQANSLISKLALLTLHFPRLRLVWSRSLHATAAIFHSLKSNQDDPDPLIAASIGVPDAAEAGGGGGESLVNTAAVDILRRLPGVTEANFRPLMARAGSLAGLAELTEAELAAVMGGALAAKKLKDWLDAPFPHL